MQTLAQQFLTEAEQNTISALVQQMEQQTSGEIVPMVVSASHSYPTAIIMGATVLAFPFSLLLMPVISGLFWLGSQNVWIFIALFITLYGVFYSLIQRFTWFKRFFLSRKQVEAEVQEAALTSFFTEKLYKTKDANGILIFISILERKVWVLADSGINACIDSGQWQGVIDVITQGIKEKRQCEAICEAIIQIGELLRTHFPVQEDDINELHNLIVR
ncbi:MAG: TPM domain-containing protein [Proteobacteria bacterium]|nr:TPM domain-containing protein [Pseudomonadota bacterium]MBU1648778.1 TPM domain-containing protein [Pseudomonadota bacterium]